jgi:hypothetical protein
MLHSGTKITLIITGYKKEPDLTDHMLQIRKYILKIVTMNNEYLMNKSYSITG